MKLEKAIEILEEESENGFFGVGSPYDYALKLSIEAMKLVRRHQLVSGGSAAWHLPGETEE